MKKAILCLLLVSYHSVSQVVNTRVLDANNVSALITDEGTFFQDQAMSVAGYEIPKGSGKKVIYNMAPWIGALDVNNIPHVAGDTFVGYHLRSGPVADQAAYSTQNYQSQYTESIWSVSADEIAYHQQNYGNPGYVPVTDIANWPGNGLTALGVADQLAPFFDVNGNGVYEPLLGDYPDIRGDQAVYTIMHDYPANGQATYMGIEVHVMAYQYQSGGYLNNTTFLNFKVYNRSTMNYHDYRQALFLDPDVGNYQDDYVGSDSVRSLAYAYNGDNYDEDDGGLIGYHSYPACMGVKSLSHVMSHFCSFNNGSVYPYNDPVISPEFWNFMNGMWADGQPWVYGGAGIPGSFGATTQPTNYIYSGNPNDSTAWTEFNPGNPPGDRRFVMTISEAAFPVGAVICSDYAILFDNSNSDPRINVQNTMDIADALQNLYDSSNEFPCSAFQLSIGEEEFADFAIYPNPGNGIFTVDFGSLEDVNIVEVRDLMGRVVFSQNSIQKDKFVFHLNERPGVYIVSIVTTTGTIAKRILIE